MAGPEGGLCGQSGKGEDPRRSAAGISAIIAVSLILGGCSGSYNAGDIGALQGAAIGGAAGAVGGQVIGRNTTATATSAAGGALIGGVLGYLISRNNTRYCHYYDNGGFPYDAPCGKP